MDPISVRKAGTALRRGAGRGPQALSELLAADKDMEAFRRWRNDPLTQAMVDTLRVLALQPAPAMLGGDDIPVQYGVTCGLQAAAALLDDPASIYPEVGVQAPDYEALVPSYAGDPNAVIDEITKAAKVAAGEPV